MNGLTLKVHIMLIDIISIEMRTSNDFLFKTSFDWLRLDYGGLGLIW